MKKFSLLSLTVVLAALSACQTPAPQKCCHQKCMHHGACPDKDKHAKPM